MSGRAVQDVIEQALGGILGRKTRIHGSGRTDAGVHARGQVFHFDDMWKHGGEALHKAFSAGLPDDVQILEAKEAPSSFHARVSARGKRYVYRAFEGKALPMEVRYRASLPSFRLNLGAMQEAARSLVGEHDFTSFGASRGYPCDDDPVRNLWRLDVRRSGRRLDVVVEGNGFLYKMVRSLCGALFDVGRGRLNVPQVKEILKSCERTALIVTSPAQGLCLDKVFYRRRCS